MRRDFENKPLYAAIAAMTIAIVFGAFAAFMTAENHMYLGQGIPSHESPPHSPIDKLISHMKWGNIAFNTPKTMRMDEAEVVHLVLSPSDPVEQLKKAIRETGKLEFHQVQYADRMEADLTSESFKITPITPMRQAVRTSGNTEWQWSIKPTESGKQHLFLRLNAIIKVDGDPTAVAVQTFSEEIVIEVPLRQRLSQFAATNWQWLCTALFIPIGGWLWKRKKEVAQQPPADKAAEPVIQADKPPES